MTKIRNPRSQIRDRFLYIILLIFISQIGCAVLESSEITLSDPNSSKLISVQFLRTIGENAQIRQPIGIDRDAFDRIYLADSGNNRILILTIDGIMIAEIGSRGWRVGEFESPSDLAFTNQPEPQIYVADSENDRIQKCRLIDRVSSVIPCEFELDRPTAVAVDHHGSIFVVDQGNHRFLKLDDLGRILLERGGFGDGPDQFQLPIDIAISENGEIIVADSGNGRIKIYDFSGNLIGVHRENFVAPTRIAIDKFGQIFLVDQNAIKIFDGSKVIFSFGSDRLDQPTGILVTKNDLIFVNDRGDNTIKIFQAIYAKN